MSESAVVIMTMPDDSPFSQKAIKAAADAFMLNQITAKNKFLEDGYRSLVQRWDEAAINGHKYGLRPVPPVKWVPVELPESLELTMIPDPAGAKVCSEVPLPDALVIKPVPALGTPSIGVEFEPGKRMVNWDDTMPWDAVVPFANALWKKTLINRTPFGEIKWYVKQS